MKKLLLTLIAYSLFTLFVTAQTNYEENKFNFEFRKAKVNSKLFEVNYASYSLKIPKGSKKVQVRFKIKSKSGKRTNFDPNKLYLLSSKYHLRIRPIDVKYTYGARMMYIGFDILSHEEQDKIPHLKYKPEIKDTFKDYSVEGFEDFSPSFNFGTKWNPIYYTPYRNHEDLRNTKIDVYFAVPEDFEGGIVFYGNEEIADFQLK